MLQFPAPLGHEIAILPFHSLGGILLVEAPANYLVYLRVVENAGLD